MPSEYKPGNGWRSCQDCAFRADFAASHVMVTGLDHLQTLENSHSCQDHAKALAD